MHRMDEEPNASVHIVALIRRLPVPESHERHRQEVEANPFTVAVRETYDGTSWWQLAGSEMDQVRLIDFGGDRDRYYLGWIELDDSPARYACAEVRSQHG